MPERSSGVDAIVLAGGRGSRMPGTDKVLATVDGRTLLARVVTAAAFCDRVVIVGPRPDHLDVPTGLDLVHTRESPHFGGPVRALRAGLAATEENSDPSDDDVVLTVSADLPFVHENALRTLVDALRSRPVEAVFATDRTGRVQYLVGAWRRGALRRGIEGALTGVDDDRERGPSVRAALPQATATIALDDVDDVDTPEELAAARAVAERVPDVRRARHLVRAHLGPRPPVAGRLADHPGGTLADPVVAARPFPTFDTSAMDGWAVVGAPPWVVDDAVVVTAGVRAPVTVGDGRAVRIATGAPVPLQASVIRDEYVTRTGRHLHRRSDAPVRDDARRIGEDWTAGAVIAPAGSPISPAVVSAALSAGVESALLRTAPRVHVVVSGDELTDAAEPPPGSIRDTVGPVLPQYLRWCGLDPVDVRRCGDTDADFDDALRDGDGDVVVIVGATGAGAADPLAGAVARAAARPVVRGMACRPGGSTSISVMPTGRVVVGLPGNPYAAVATACVLLPDVARALTGGPAPHRPTGVPAAPIPSSDVTRVLPAAMTADGRWRVAESVRTAHLAALVDHEALAVLNPGREPTDPVEIVLLPPR
ncbi:NTP transferase domain-containing protein [Rhodococcoides corynebacterioides]|uniref:Molybdopterin molybdenumtransferase n=1 Tax=Rhodococcoides corynebacterioides TaxID=53972 RepID=A0ABS7P2Q4_9NOCA|nr:NTP transferase domain-containing protein [Rhodococcus corynebacterioides]MBY6365949.1 NTP transferase domain-containing protein [Rhodococcus corynebacterioides]MBY6408592.1 NTP transferase domain-containing protein [Rhodococcus corynebacterioides]